jgi:hypothetical protein
VIASELFEFVHNEEFVSFQMLCLAHFAIRDQVHGRLDFVELPHFDSVLPQKMQRPRHRRKLLRIGTIDDSNGA